MNSFFSLCRNESYKRSDKLFKHRNSFIEPATRTQSTHDRGKDLFYCCVHFDFYVICLWQFHRSARSLHQGSFKANNGSANKKLSHCGFNFHLHKPTANCNKLASQWTIRLDRRNFREHHMQADFLRRTRLHRRICDNIDCHFLRSFVRNLLSIESTSFPQA